MTGMRTADARAIRRISTPQGGSQPTLGAVMPSSVQQSRKQSVTTFPTTHHFTWYTRNTREGSLTT